MAKVIAAYGGGFKPPTAGHFEVVKRALEQFPEIDELTIYVGGGERDGITQSEAVLIWEIYQTYLPMKVKIEPSKAPIGDIIRLGKNNPQDTVYFVIGAREKNEGDLKDIESRTKGVEEKYPNMKIKVISTPGGGMSGTNARRAAKVSPEEFYKYLPTELTDGEKEEVYNIVKPMVKETLNENASYSSDIDYKEHIKELTKYMIKDGWNILPLPKVVFKHGDSENARDFFGKTAYYDPNTQTIVLYTEGRHPKDIVRSFSHEMVHHEQNLEGRLGDIATTNTQEDDRLNDIEKEANLNGTMTFRNWTDSLQEKKKKDHFGLDQYARELAQGLEESLNEGRYDSISRQLASIALNAWKSDFKDGASYGYFVGEITPEEYPTDLTFTFKALGRFVDGKYTHNGYSKSDGEVGVKYEIPKDSIPQIWEEVYMDLISTIRHEIEHQTQGGKNVKQGKGMESDQKLRQLIRKGGGDIVKYVTLPKEIESNVHGLYLKAKKWRRPYEEIVDEYIKDFLKITNPADVNYVKSKWQEVAKKRSLPDLLNEGVYDSIVSKLAKNVINTWKGQFDENPKRLFSLLNTSYEFEDAKGRPLDFEFIAKLDFKKTKDRNYKVDGGANEGDDETDGFVALNFQVDPRELPRMWSTIAMDIRDVLRHEIEHLTQGGWNERSGKYMEDDSFIRDLIQKYKTLAPKNYFMLDKEVDAMLQGMYFKAKKSRTPFADVIDDYLDKVGLEPEEKEEIKTRWRGRIKALSLPLFEELEEMEYEIYSDMDGVITDFDASFMKASDGIRPSEYERNMGKDKFWELIDGKGVGFWVGMPWMSDGKQYWDYIKEYNPILLSSPSRSETSRLGKRLWVRNQLPGTKLILAQAKDKQNYARKNRILIDDRPSNIEEWRSQGGVGILHTSASNTIRQLKELGL